MAYQQIFVNSILDIPAEIGNFADLNGWDVDLTNPNQPILTHPFLVGALPMRFRATISGANNQNHDLIIESTNPIATTTAVTRSPKLSGTTNNPTVPVPTSVHLFADVTGEPFISGAIEYGTNRFRHFYFGYMNKADNYIGGEIISGSAGPDSNTAANILYADTLAGKYLFSGKQSVFTVNQSGGARVDISGNPTTWRVNQTPSGTSIFTLFNNTQLLGGFRDGLNDPYIARAQSSYAGAAVLVPVNMYATLPITGDTLFTPLGDPEGVRLVNIQNLEVGQVVDIGGVLWKCFPAMSKRLEVNMPNGGGNYRQFESSWNVGYAHRVN
jgi:hypothetical protein